MLRKYARPCIMSLGLAIGALAASAATPQAAGAAEQQLERFERMLGYLSPRGKGNPHYIKGELLTFQTLVLDDRQPLRPARYGHPPLQDMEAEVTVDFRHSIQVIAHFPSGGTAIGGKAETVLNDVAQAINAREMRGYKFMIIGNTDNVGDSEANEFLSWQRAQAFRRHLISRSHIDPRRLIPVGMGEARPLDKQNPEADINRRIDIVLIKHIRFGDDMPPRQPRMVCLPDPLTGADTHSAGMDLDDYGGFRRPARCSFDDEIAIDFDE